MRCRATKDCYGYLDIMKQTTVREGGRMVIAYPCSLCHSLHFSHGDPVPSDCAPVEEKKTEPVSTEA